MNRAQLDLLLSRLWARCEVNGGSSEADWSALHRFVSSVLMNCNAPELGGLPDERRAYVDSYFVDKIFLGMKPGSRPYHCGALVVFFRRYLRSELDRVAKLVPLGEEQADEGEEGGSERERRAPDDFQDLDRVLREGCGKTVEEVARSAEQFLAHLQREEEWAWLMLRDGFFADQGERASLSTLAEVHQIPSWHYRARRLGINHKGGKDPELFRNTMLGAWLEEALGRPISREVDECVKAAIEILGFQALRE